MKKLLAFSLAEVLIALSIVGIVGALTLPNVKKTYMQKEAHAKATKVQHVLDTATIALVKDKGSLDAVVRGISDEEDRSMAFLDAYAKYMKFTNVCGKTSSSTACFPTGAFADPLNTSAKTSYDGKTCQTKKGALLCTTVPASKPYFTPLYPNCSPCDTLNGKISCTEAARCVVTSVPGNDSSKCATAILNDGTAIAFCDVSDNKPNCTPSTSIGRRGLMASASISANYCPSVAVYFSIKGAKQQNTLAMSRNVFFGYLTDEGFNDTYKSIASISAGAFNDDIITTVVDTNSGPGLVVGF